MTSSDPYEILGLSPGATTQEIRSAFRRKVRASHPDTNSEPGSEGDVIAVVDAYRQLMALIGAAEDTTGSNRRVEVRHTTPDRRRPTSVPCPSCSGQGIVVVSEACFSCGGTGTITRLDAHRASEKTCRHCRGRGGIRHFDECGSCRGSGRSLMEGE